MAPFHIDSSFSSSTESRSSWEVAERWIRRCAQDHKICLSLAEQPRWYPNRLLEIRVDSLRLIETESEAPTGLYVTPSHCWGKARMLTLKGDNLDGLRQSIPVSHLPKTFREAVKITKRLNINYIWIDSLCIIQDSEDDWLKEASLMHKLYSNGYCNIAATGARDSTYGLFVERDVRHLEPMLVDLDWRHSGVTSFELVYWDMWQQQLSYAPLNQRAWVVQERLLAPRVLHFGQQQILFECCEFDACEQYPHGLPPILGNTAYSGLKGLDLNVDSARLARLARVSARLEMYGLEL